MFVLHKNEAETTLSSLYLIMQRAGPADQDLEWPSARTRERGGLPPTWAVLADRR